MSDVNSPAQIAGVRFTGSSLVVSLSDDREISTPLSWYPKLLKASWEERNQIEISPFGLHWPALDEDLSLAGMLSGRPSIAELVLKVHIQAVPLDINDQLYQKWSFAYGNVVTDDEDKVPTEVLDRLHNEIDITRIDR